MFNSMIFELQIMTDSIELLRNCLNKHQEISSIQKDNNNNNEIDIGKLKLAKSEIQMTGQKIRKLYDMTKNTMRYELGLVLDLPLYLLRQTDILDDHCLKLLCKVKEGLLLSNMEEVTNIEEVSKDDEIIRMQNDDLFFVCIILERSIISGNIFCTDLRNGLKNLINLGDSLKQEWNNLSLLNETERSLKELERAMQCLEKIDNLEQEKNIQSNTDETEMKIDALITNLLTMCDTRFGNLPRTIAEVQNWANDRVERFLHRAYDETIQESSRPHLYLMESLVKCLTIDNNEDYNKNNNNNKNDDDKDDLWASGDITRHDLEEVAKTYLLRSCSFIWRTEYDCDPHVLLKVLSNVPTDQLAHFLPPTQTF